MNEGFYKYEEPFLLYGTTVLDANYELFTESKDNHVYPIDGWYWFDSREEATQFFGIEEPENNLDDFYLYVNI